MRFFSILGGFAFVLFILWNRLLRERIPRILDNNYTQFQLIIMCCVAVISLIMMCYYLRKILNIQIKENSIIIKIFNMPCLQIITNFFYQYILNAPLNTYEFLYKYVRIVNIVQFIGAKIWNMDPYKYPMHVFCFLMSLRIIVVLVFIFDVLYFRELDLFYKTLLILFVPLVINSILFIIKNTSKKNRDYIVLTHVKITSNQEKNGFVAEPVNNVSLTEEEIYAWYNTWICHTANCMFVDKIQEIQDYYGKFVMFIYYTIYTIGWCSVLIRYFLFIP